MAKADKKTAKHPAISVNWAVTRGDITISGTDKSITEAVEMARWASSELEHAELHAGDDKLVEKDEKVAHIHSDEE
jgi:hypothetical protein